MLIEVNPNTSNTSIESAKQNLKATNSTLQFSSAYTYQGKRGYPTNQISLSLKPNTSITQVNALFGNQYVSATTNKYNSCYTLTLKDVKDLFSLTESIYQSSLVEWAEPSFISAYLNNPLYPQQYYLNNTGQNSGTVNIDINAPEAWALLQNCTGNPRVRVAVIDDGVETHQDLTNLSPNGFDIDNMSNPGRPVYTLEGHGQACAGIIGADNNGLGTRGVATNVEIIPARIFVDQGGNAAYAYSAPQIARTIDWAWKPQGGNADILSNSWSGGFPNTEIIDAIQRARTLGRNGKGCVVIFSSGNRQLDMPGVLFPGTINGVITVGAVNKNGAIWDYSNRGPEMSLVAPSGELFARGGGDVVTMDRMGTNGFETGDYTSRFGGTSAAAPQVAGVAALMLQANPNLTEVEVRTILQQTARDVGVVGFDNDTGYGLVDAEKAVRRVLFGANNIYISGTSGFCTGSGGTYNLSSVPAGATITWQVTGNIILTSGQGTPTANVSASGYGPASIQATITNCGASYPIPAYSIFVNVSPGLGVNYTYTSGLSISLSLSSTNNLCLGYTSRGYLIATISSGTVTFTAISGLTIAYRDGRSAYFTLLPGVSVGRVRVSSSNGCGAETQEMAFQITNCGTPSYPGDPNPTDPCNIQPRLYNISPNPATFGQIKIGTVERPMEVVCPVNPKIQAILNSKEGITFSEVNIYNSFGMLVLSKQTNKAKEFVIPLNELKTGLYLVQISEGEHIERHQIIIE